MQYSWTKLPTEDEAETPQWGVRAAAYGSGGPRLATGQSGETVYVQKKDGGGKHVTLGAQVLTWNGGRVAVYAVAAQERQGRPKAAPKDAAVVSGASAIRQAAVAARRGVPADGGILPPRMGTPAWQRQQAAKPERVRKLTPAADAVRLPDGGFDAYDIVFGYVGHERVIERAVEFLIDAWHVSWWPSDPKPTFETAPEAALAWLTEEGRVLNEQVAYERANGWSTD